MNPALLLVGQSDATHDRPMAYEGPKTAEERAFVRLAEHFLDTETRQSIPATALACLEASLDEERLTTFYWGEIVPRFGPNLFSMTGEWTGFDDDAELARRRSRARSPSSPSSPSRLEVLGGRIFGALVPGAGSTLASIVAFHRLLTRAPSSDREALTSALGYLGRAYVEMGPLEPASLPPASEAMLDEKLRADFTTAMRPVVLLGEARLAGRRLDVAFAQLANRRANGVDLRAALVDHLRFDELALLPFELPARVREQLFISYVTFARPYRAYHDLSHIVEMLGTVRRIGGFRSLPTVELATLFHDATYDAKAKDNEARSAEVMLRVVRDTPLESLGPAAAKLILLTARHGSIDGTSLDSDTRRFLDCDLSVLAAEPARYDAYDRAVAAEYGHLHRKVYRVGRRRFLEKLLARERIFFSDDLHAAWDARARANLRRSLAQT